MTDMQRPVVSRARGDSRGRTQGRDRRLMPDLVIEREVLIEAPRRWYGARSPSLIR